MAKLNNETKAQESNPAPRTDSVDREVEVLYQRLGSKWFAFSLIDDEVFVGSIAPEEISSNHDTHSKNNS